MEGIHEDRACPECGNIYNDYKCLNCGYEISESLQFIREKNPGSFLPSGAELAKMLEDDDKGESK